MTEAIEELARLAQVLRLEQEEDLNQHQLLLNRSSIFDRKRAGLTWFPLRIIEEGYGIGAYPFLVVERNAADTLAHQFGSSSPVTLYTALPGYEKESLNGTIGYVDDSRMKIVFRCDELPEWIDEGKLGVNLQFDARTYDEMFLALNQLINTEKGRAAELREIILGHRDPSFRVLQPVVNDRLNQSQREAMQSILEAEDLAIVHGPPGTGKTTTLVESAAGLLEQGGQILVCAPSNAATDHLVRSLAARGLRVVRLGNLAKVDSDTTGHTIDVKLQQSKEFKQVRELKKKSAELRKMGGKYRRQFGKEEAEQRRLIYQEARSLNREARDMESYLVQKILDEAQVVATTLIGSTHEYLGNRRFTAVFIDEAGQALEPACWVPILKAEKVIMAGDPHQLPPTVKSREAEKRGLAVTLMEKAIRRHKRVNLLRIQYRMNAHIMAFSNQQFYEGQLEAHDSVKEHGLGDGGPAFEFIDTAGCGFEERQAETGESRCNPEEADLVRNHYNVLFEAGRGSVSVGVISPYRAQIDMLRERFSGEQDVVVNTIDSFQGQERDVIYISMVRSNASGDIGFLRDYRRMNVAMTRARKKLVIIGDSATLASDRFYQQFLDYCEHSGAYRSAWEFRQ